MRRLLLLSGALLLLFAASAAAQSDCQPNQCTNPSTLIFDASSDHNVTEFGQPKVTSYAVEYWAAGATVPTQSTSIGKPAPDPQNNITVDLRPLSRPISLAGVYTIKVAAIGPGGTAKTNPSVPFSLAATAPAAPQKVPIIR